MNLINVIKTFFKRIGKESKIHENEGWKRVWPGCIHL
jgi:hypothetical protein